MINAYITIGGQGTRLKCLSPKDKHKLYYKDKRIVDWILSIVPEAQLLGNKKTNNRKETLSAIANQQNILIIDCDIIPFGLDLSLIDTETDNLFVFESNKHKWGSAKIENKILVSCDENNNISNYKCSGIYYIKNMQKTLEEMNDNSIASGIIGAKTIVENSFARFGDVEDYMEAISYDYN